MLGLEDLCATLKDVIKASFEARAKAYDDEVRSVATSGLYMKHAEQQTGHALLDQAWRKLEDVIKASFGVRAKAYDSEVRLISML